MANLHHFNEVFFEDVRVPASSMVGEENRGWYVGATLLDFERSNISMVIALRHTVNDIVAYVTENPDGRSRPTGPVRLELADRTIEAEIARMFSYRIVSMQKRGLVPNYEASMSKIWRSETQQRIAATGIRLIGLYGNLWPGSPWAPLQGHLSRAYVEAASRTIAGGTSEIQRNVIATRGLGLPRG
jgi:3-oxocholest-4-en-26-oyl-CoA dehydrogenase alpha subunit